MVVGVVLVVTVGADTYSMQRILKKERMACGQYHLALSFTSTPSPPLPHPGCCSDAHRQYTSLSPSAACQFVHLTLITLS